MKPTPKRKRRLLPVLLVILVLLIALAGYAATRLGVFGAEDEWQNFLLIGTDSRKDEDNAGRSDTMIVCSVNAAQARVKLPSLARDMWVTFPGDYGSGKLNAAIRYGGPQLLLDTIRETFGLPIDEYVSINFYGLMDIVDALGGVDVEISSKEAGVINRNVAEQFKQAQVTRLREGNAHMAGVQALTFARIRNLDSDFGRTGRQRRLLTAMLAKVRRGSPADLYRFASTCMEHTDTNISLDRMLSLAGPLLLRGLDSFEEKSLPSAGNYRHATRDGVSRIEFDAEQVKQELHRFIYEQ